jgi:glycine oxidase
MDADVLVVGAGVIGLTIARAVARGGGSVTVVDPAEPGSGATRAAAGILSPTDPHEWAEPLGPYNLAAIVAWPGWAAELAAETGADAGYDPMGELRVGGEDGEAFLAASLEGARAGGLTCEPVDAAALRALEPGLAPPPGGTALHFPHSAAVRVDALVPALASACEGAGVRFVRDAVTAIDLARPAVRLSDGADAAAGALVLAGGAWMQQTWVPEEIRPPVRPVLGENLQVRPDAPVVERMIRTPSGSIVPRRDGTVWLGTTVRERGFQPRPGLGSVRGIANRAAALLPALDDALFVEARSGLRPQSADGLPIVGPVRDRVVLAGGHGREGIMHAPQCAEQVARGLAEDRWDGVPDAFRPAPERFRT